MFNFFNLAMYNIKEVYFMSTNMFYRHFWEVDISDAAAPFSAEYDEIRATIEENDIDNQTYNNDENLKAVARRDKRNRISEDNYWAHIEDPHFFTYNLDYVNFLSSLNESFITLENLPDIPEKKRSLNLDTDVKDYFFKIRTIFTFFLSRTYNRRITDLVVVNPRKATVFNKKSFIFTRVFDQSAFFLNDDSDSIFDFFFVYLFIIFIFIYLLFIAYCLF